jgi:protein-S-isoprenylcysteine O-methyltransferase Ste14
MEHKVMAATGSVAFFLPAPGLIAGSIPWLVTGWYIRQPSTYWVPLLVVGVLLLIGGAIVLVQTLFRFVVEGFGTPAPAAPTEYLVVGGQYRYVRNPMSLAVVAIILGQALALGQPILLLYTALVGVAVGAFVRFYEEPTLARRFGSQYEAYRRQPWEPGRDDERRSE